MRLPAASVLACALAFATLAPSTSFRALEAGTAARAEIEDLVAQCDLALEGRVLEVRAVERGPRRIETEVRVRVTRNVWGAASGDVTLRIPGGVLPDGRGLVLPGLPRFVAGEDTLVFLSCESARGIRMPVGLAQGKFRIEARANGARALVRDQQDLELLDLATGRVQPADARASFDYAAVHARIDAAVAARRQRVSTGGGR